MNNRSYVVQYLYSQPETVGLEDKGDVITKLFVDGEKVSTSVIRLVVDNDAHITRRFDFTSLGSGDELFYFLNESKELFTMDLPKVKEWNEGMKVDFDTFNREPQLRSIIKIKKINLA
jgi:hypothetical protein